MKCFFAACGLLALAASGVNATDDTNSTRSLQAKLSPGSVGDGTIAIFTIAQAIVPAILGGQDKKDCHQTACWIATTTEACGMTAANQVQRELMRGRNSFGVESVNAQGMWVRYWRTQFNPPDGGVIADGKCGGGSPFTVTNCMSTGKVYC